MGVVRPMADSLVIPDEQIEMLRSLPRPHQEVKNSADALSLFTAGWITRFGTLGDGTAVRTRPGDVLLATIDARESALKADWCPDMNFVGTLKHRLTPYELIVGNTDLSDVLDAVQGDEVRLSINRIGDKDA